MTKHTYVIVGKAGLPVEAATVHEEFQWESRKRATLHAQPFPACQCQDGVVFRSSLQDLPAFLNLTKMRAYPRARCGVIAVNDSQE
jgi:hypothetical protein